MSKGVKPLTHIIKNRELIVNIPERRIALTKELLLMDGNSYLHRAFHAFPEMNAPDGTPTNVVYGFLKMLETILLKVSPTHLAVCFDASRKTFRRELYSEYKANRKPAAAELAKQFPLIREVLAALNIPYFHHPYYEADDLLGTIATRSEMPTKIASGDRDVYQLISPQITVLYYKKKGYVEMKHGGIYLGYPSDKMIDIKALAGDTADNIPGCPGIGEKTAINLIEKYGSAEEVLNNAESIPGKLGQNIRANREKILISFELAKINCDCPLEVDYDDLLMDIDPVIGSLMLTRLGIKSINLEGFGKPKTKRAQNPVLSLF